MLYKQVPPIHCVLVVRSFGSRPAPSPITQLLFGWDWDLHSTEVCTFTPGSFGRKKTHDPWGLASSAPYFSQLSSSVCCDAGSWFFVVFHMLCLPYFTLSKGAPQLCTFAPFGESVAPSSKRLHAIQQEAIWKNSQSPSQQLTIAFG